MYSAYLHAYPSMLRHFALSTVESYEHDLTILHYMASIAFDALEQPSADDAAPANPISVQTRALPDGLKLRIVRNTATALSHNDLPFVGFISRKQPSIAPDIQRRIDAADDGMLLALSGIPALLRYISLQLADENWYNLVIFAQEGAKRDILATSLHHHAAYDLAPLYYQWIRLHHGIIQQAGSAPELTLHTTKYYVFSTPAAAPAMYVQAYRPAHALASAV